MTRSTDTQRRTTLAAALGLACLAAVSLLSARAGAHAIGLSTGEYAAKGETVQVKLAFARGELAGVVPGLDENHDGHVTALEVEGARKELERNVLAKIHVTAGGAPCAPVLTGAGITEQDGLTVDGRFDCGSSTNVFDVDVALLDDLSQVHRHVARAVGTSTHDEVLYNGHATFSIAPPAASSVATPDAAAPASATRQGPRGAWAFFALGIEHILTGYDHLVFLFGVVLLRAKTKELLVVVSAFTIAQSITLAIALLGLFAPSPRLVEPAIALSIAYVGVENFFVKDCSERWRVTFPFGLIHGFAFAEALQKTTPPTAQVPTALISLSLGVEAGQLLAIAFGLPVMMLIRQTAWFEPKGVRVLSAAVALAGGCWFVIRVAAG